MRMSAEMREILTDINTTRNQLNDAIKSKDVKQCNELKDKLENLNTLYDAAEANFIADRSQQFEDPELNNQNRDTTPVYNSELFYKTISGQALSEPEKNAVISARTSYDATYRNSVSETVKENGGYTVPPDLSTEILQAISSSESVRNIISVENVKSVYGRRNYKSGKEMKLYNTAEAEEIKELNNQNYNYLEYNQKKFAAIMTVSNELLADSYINFKNELIDWLSKCSNYTENREILYGIGGEKHCQGLISTPGIFKEITPTKASDITIDYLRRIKLKIKAGYRVNAKWIMNSDAFAFISELKDGNGRSYIQPDPMNAEQYKLLGGNIYVMDSIDTDEGKTVIMYGDFERAYRMFSRSDFGIAMTDIGAGAFETDSIKLRGIERFDGKIMDRNAVIIIRDVPVSPLDISEPDADFGAPNKITKETLSALTKADLLEIAAEYEIVGLTDSSTKATIINAIMEAITPEVIEETT